MSQRRSAGSTLVLLMLIASGCSWANAHTDHRVSSSPSTPSLSPADARDRLIALGEAWLATPVTIGYRTVGRVEGQPSSTHQCLRQLVGGAIDRTTGLRMCSRQGQLELAWDPPHRWRMDVTSPVDRFTVLSTPEGASICRRSSGGQRSCHRISEPRARSDSTFEFLFERPEEILAEIEAVDVGLVSSTGDIAGTPVECFAATGPAVHVEWCYSSEGLLLSFLRGSGTLGWQSLDASRITENFAKDTFEVAP